MVSLCQFLFWVRLLVLVRSSVCLLLVDSVLLPVGSVFCFRFFDFLFAGGGSSVAVSIPFLECIVW